MFSNDEAALMAGLHLFDSHREAANAWLRPLIEDFELAPGEYPRALQALRAGLHAIRDGLPAAEAVDLAAPLPTLLRGIYYDGWKLGNVAMRIRDRAAMLARVDSELGPPPHPSAHEVLRSVISLLVVHLSPAEIRRVVATLPEPIAALWQELSSPAPDAIVDPARQAQVRRTGYLR
ncbi:MAG TPA: DUF2267 domain-containing protein [Kofleriaceae bacterium]|jgi:uncharacterized protein (DUF2267 family)|nr:DUF2267 domain-containing protein [Kofleriaceae bacterium]